MLCVHVIVYVCMVVRGLSLLRFSLFDSRNSELVIIYILFYRDVYFLGGVMVMIVW